MEPSPSSNRTPGWLLDEVASAGRENLDAAHVARYDDKEDADAASEVDLLVSLGMGSDATLLDMGAGTGQLALAAAERCSRVVAVDVSPVMLEQLRANVAAAGHRNLEVVEGGFLSYEHRGAPVDVVYSRYALHHLPDFWKSVALSRLHDVLRPDGILRLWDVVYDFDPSEAGERIEAWCADFVEASGDGGWNRADLEEHVRDEHSTFTWLLEPILERCGFVIEGASSTDDGIFARYVLRRR